ncbi:unnamed protein product [Darwinula stevensoni]|uniref:Uncharacterized protein n=1 Tax=Darwinula stevensoni TaxID=69355 RepID=A0A7R9A8P3_9CRUS|nr:unnamed protein product [Darwinula stevensoni]CAG0896436.1 unnamed protein product [Darwinula stevensoni]
MLLGDWMLVNPIHQLEEILPEYYLEMDNPDRNPGTSLDEDIEKLFEIPEYQRFPFSATATSPSELSHLTSKQHEERIPVHDEDVVWNLTLDQKNVLMGPVSHICTMTTLKGTAFWLELWHV